MGSGYPHPQPRHTPHTTSKSNICQTLPNSWQSQRTKTALYFSVHLYYMACIAVAVKRETGCPTSNCLNTTVSSQRKRLKSVECRLCCLNTSLERERERESYCLNGVLSSDETEHWGVWCWWQTKQYFSAGSVAVSQGAAVRQHSSWWTQREGILQRSEQEPWAGAGSGVPHRWKSRTLALSVPTPICLYQ